MSTDYKALCAELADALAEWQLGGGPPEDTADADLINRARAALAQPEPVALTDDEAIEEAAKLIHASMRLAVPDNHCTRDWVEPYNSLMQDEARRTARAVLARYGTAAAQPVQVSERLPGPTDCDADGFCWFWDYGWTRQQRGWHNDECTHWLPHWALPVPAPAIAAELEAQ